MGMANSAQAFQRLADSVLAGMTNTFCYLDDILVYSRSQAEHLKTLEELFQRLSKAGLSIVLKKCEFGQSSLDYLGYTISAQGLAPIKKKVHLLVEHINGNIRQPINILIAIIPHTSS